MNINDNVEQEIIDNIEDSDNIIPTTFEEYELVEDENLKINDEVDIDFKKLAHTLKLNKSQVKSLSVWANQKSLESINKSNESAIIRKNEALTELKNEWGAMHETNLKKSIIAAERISSLSPDFADYLNRTTAGDDPSFIKVVFKLGELISEDKLTNSTRNNTADDKYLGDMPLLSFNSMNKK